jgi:hypothetical protein
MADDSLANSAGSSGERGDAIVVDFDFVLTDGHEILELAAENALGGRGVELTHAMFSRRLLGIRVLPAFSALLPAGAEIAPDKFAAQVFDAADKALDGAPMRKTILDYLKKAEAEGAELMFVTMRNQSVVEQKLECAGFVEPRVLKIDRYDTFGEFPGDTWQKAARFARPASGRCILLLGSANSVRCALSLGKRAQPVKTDEEESVILPSPLASRIVAVVPPILSHQDYAGADYVFDAQPEAELAAQLASVEF